jgi:hypothetical protein
MREKNGKMNGRKKRNEGRVMGPNAVDDGQSP